MEKANKYAFLVASLSEIPVKQLKQKPLCLGINSMKKKNDEHIYRYGRVIAIEMAIRRNKLRWH